MANDFEISTSARNACVDAVSALIDGGTGAGRIEIRTGTQPANLSDPSSGTLLATLTFNADSFPAASGGSASANGITSDTSADNDGVAGYFRFYPGAAADTAAVAQGTCGDGGDAPVDLQFDNKNIVTGGTVAISSFSLTQPIQ